MERKHIRDEESTNRLMICSHSKECFSEDCDHMGVHEEESGCSVGFCDSAQIECKCIAHNQLELITCTHSNECDLTRCIHKKPHCFHHDCVADICDYMDKWVVCKSEKEWDQ